jgi:hypothetical protein
LVPGLHPIRTSILTDTDKVLLFEEGNTSCVPILYSCFHSELGLRKGSSSHWTLYDEERDGDDEDEGRILLTL